MKSKTKYRVMVWDWSTGQPFLKIGKIVKSYNTVDKMRKKYNNFEVHSWPVDNEGKPINHL